MVDERLGSGDGHGVEWLLGDLRSHVDDLTDDSDVIVVVWKC